MNEIIDHKEAFELASYKRKNSNLARCYLEMQEHVETLVVRFGLYGGTTIDDLDTKRAVRELTRMVMQLSGNMEHKEPSE